MPVSEAAPQSSLIIPSYGESLVWQQNKHRAGTEMVRAVRFISWLNQGLTPEQIAELLEHDDAAYEEAKQTDDLLFYHAAEIETPVELEENKEDIYLGVPDYKENTCGWRSVSASQLALHGLKHRQAVTFAIENDIYEEVRIEVLDSTYVGEGEYEFDLINVMTKDDILEHAARAKSR